MRFDDYGSIQKEFNDHLFLWGQNVLALLPLLNSTNMTTLSCDAAYLNAVIKNLACYRVQNLVVTKVRFTDRNFWSDMTSLMEKSKNVQKVIVHSWLERPPNLASGFYLLGLRCSALLDTEDFDLVPYLNNLADVTETRSIKVYLMDGYNAGYVPKRPGYPRHLRRAR